MEKFSILFSVVEKFLHLSIDGGAFNMGGPSSCRPFFNELHFRSFSLATSLL